MISCIIPVNESEEFVQRLIMVLQSLDHFGLEVVVSQVGKEKLDLSNFDVKHIFTHSNKKKFNLSQARNIGAENANGEYFYFTDADIFFHDPDYFTNLPIDGGINPLMRRMSSDDVEIFSQYLKDHSYLEALKIIDTSAPYTSRVKNTEVVVHRKLENAVEETFLATRDDLDTYLALGKPKGMEPMFWTMDRHYGALYINREDFFKVEGYYEEFQGWGCEDDDIKRRLPNYKTIRGEVTHLDHSRGHFEKSDWKKNKKLLEARKNENEF
jgi:glycosyltransferase involved in cell wall biosynthesis